MKILLNNSANSLSDLIDAHTAHVVYYAQGIQASFYLIHTVSRLLELAAVSKAVPTSKVSLWRVSLSDSEA